MIDAPIIVHGCGDDIHWGTWTFEQLPSPGDIISLIRRGHSHDLKVRHVEHYPSWIDRPGDGAPSSLVVADWLSGHAAPEGTTYIEDPY